MHKHAAWARNSTEVSKVDRLRRSYFLGDNGTIIQSSVEKKRMSIHHNRYFAQQLLDYDIQRIEAAEGEEEANYGDYAAKKRDNMIQLEGVDDQLEYHFNTIQALSRRRAKIDDEDMEDETDSYDRDEEEYRRQSKKPMEAKQGLLHLLSTEIVLNTRLRGELTCFRTTFDSWNPLLPHQTIYTVLDFLGVSDRWRKFFERYLQAPLKFTDDPLAEPRLRCRGMPGSHALSDVLGEAVLFCLDFAVNQATGGPDLYRLGDDIWFWNKKYNACADAWASIVKFTEVTGVRVSLQANFAILILLTTNLVGREEDGQCSHLTRL
jgi:hypothetical protein